MKQGSKCNNSMVIWSKRQHKHRMQIHVCIWRYMCSINVMSSSNLVWAKLAFTKAVARPNTADTAQPVCSSLTDLCTTWHHLAFIDRVPSCYQFIHLWWRVNKHPHVTSTPSCVGALRVRRRTSCCTPTLFPLSIHPFEWQCLCNSSKQLSSNVLTELEQRFRNNLWRLNSGSNYRNMVSHPVL